MTNENQCAAEAHGDERAAFETWLETLMDTDPRANCCIELATALRGDGHYVMAETRIAWDAWQARAAQESSKVQSATTHEQALSEMDGVACPRCLGSGSIAAMSNGGPDAHEIDVDCHHCGGTGSARDAYLNLADFYSKAKR